MPIFVIPVEKAVQAFPTTRFAASYVTGPQAIFKWHYDAKPKPVYRICLVQITAIASTDQVTVRCFTQDGTLGPAMDVNLADWNHAWRTAPSTIDPVPATVGELGTDSCALLCLSDAVLKRYIDPDLVAFAKYPFGEDALVLQNAKLLAAIAALRIEVDSEFFKKTLDHLKLGNLNLNE
jgi:hypothetical protein